MSEIRPSPQKPGPALPETIVEVRGIFPGDAALQDAVGRLTLAGFDRADLSLPVPAAAPAEATPEQGADNPDTDDDSRQMRTIHTSMAGSAAAMLAAGAVVATGGAALPAVAASVAAGGVAHGLSHAADSTQHEEREAAAAQGDLVLAVRVTSETKLREAEAAMRQAGATRIDPVART